MRNVTTGHMLNGRTGTMSLNGFFKKIKLIISLLSVATIDGWGAGFACKRKKSLYSINNGMASYKFVLCSAVKSVSHLSRMQERVVVYRKG